MSSADPDAAAAGAATGTCAGAFVWPPLTRRKAPWRMTPSVILSTREISASVSARRGEEQQVVDRLALVVDLVGEPAAAPRLVAVPGALRGFHGVADALDDLGSALFAELRVQQQHDFVVVQEPEFLLLMD